MDTILAGAAAAFKMGSPDAYAAEGKFVIEDGDIVKLLSTGHGPARSGWVNVGSHVIQIAVNDAGDITVGVMARAPIEHVALASCVVTRSQSAAAGGIDPDADNQDGDSGGSEIRGPEGMTPPWKEEHAHAALLEGWNIFECNGSQYGPWQIQRLDHADETPGAAQLESDVDAWDLVLTGAGAHHAAALKFLRAHNPIDYEALMAHAELRGVNVPGLSLP